MMQVNINYIKDFIKENFLNKKKKRYGRMKGIKRHCIVWQRTPYMIDIQLPSSTILHILPMYQH